MSFYLWVFFDFRQPEKAMPTTQSKPCQPIEGAKEWVWRRYAMFLNLRKFYFRLPKNQNIVRIGLFRQKEISMNTTSTDLSLNQQWYQDYTAQQNPTNQKLLQTAQQLAEKYYPANATGRKSGEPLIPRVFASANGLAARCGRRHHTHLRAIAYPRLENRSDRTMLPKCRNVGTRY